MSERLYCGYRSNVTIDDLNREILELKSKIESLIKENKSYRKLLGLEVNENLQTR